MTNTEGIPTAATPKSKAVLALVAAASLVITLASNGLVSRTLPPQHRWIADACLPSLLAALALYLLMAPKRPFGWVEARTPWRRLVRLAAIWLAFWWLATALYALIEGRWSAYTQGTANVLCFGLIGPLAEELLFRGAIFELAERAFVRSAIAPLLVSTLLFSLYHLQLHGFRISPFLAFQLAFTLPMGWVFARLRSLSGSIWPSFVVHVLTNLPHCFGAPPTHGV